MWMHLRLVPQYHQNLQRQHTCSTCLRPYNTHLYNINAYTGRGSKGPHWYHGSFATPLLRQEASFTQLLLHSLRIGAILINLQAPRQRTSFDPSHHVGSCLCITAASCSYAIITLAHPHMELDMPCKPSPLTAAYWCI